MLERYEKAVSKMKEAMINTDVATDISDIERQKSRKKRLACSCGT